MQRNCLATDITTACLIVETASTFVGFLFENAENLIIVSVRCMKQKLNFAVIH